MFTRFQISSQPGMALVRPDGEVELLMGAASGDIIDSLIQQALDA